MKVTCWEVKLINVLVDPIKETIDESKIESKLNYYYQRLDTQDLVVASQIGDVESNQQLLTCMRYFPFTTRKERTSIKFSLRKI